MCNVYCMVRVFGGKKKNNLSYMCVCACVRACVSDCVCIDYQWLNPRLADTGSVPDVNAG